MANRSGLVLFLLALFVAPFSYAQGVNGFTGNWSVSPGGSDFAKLISDKSISATASNGSRASVPVTATVNVSKSVIAANAVRIARAGSAIGVGFLAWDTYNAIKDSGVSTCPPPDFFCKPGGAPTESAPLGGQWKDSFGTSTVYSSEQAVYDFTVNIYQDSFPPSQGWYWRKVVVSPNSVDYYVRNNSCAYGPQGCSAEGIRQAGATKVVQGTCPTGSTYNSSTNKCDTPAQAVPFGSEADMVQKIMDTGWDSSMYEKMWKAVEGDAKLRASQVPQGVTTLTGRLGSDSLVFISGPSVPTPQVTTKTRVITNPDGTTSTETVKEQTTFTPSQTGTKVSDTEPVIKPTTVVTTTITNNTTNQTTTNVETQTPIQPPAEPPSDMCKTNPDALACKTLGGPLEATPVPNENKLVSIVPDTGWGASNGSCPAPGSFTAMGKTIAVPWDVFCQFAQGIRPFLIAVAYMIAVGGFIGLSRKD